MASAVVMPRDVLSPPGTNSIVRPSDQESTEGRVLPSQERLEDNSLLLAIPAMLPAGSRLPAVPSKVLFGALRSPSLQLRQPIPLRVERDQAGVSVIWEGAEEFGRGDTFSDAIDDFSHTIAELYLCLSVTSESFSGHLLEVRERLSRYIAKRDRDEGS